MKSIPMRGSEKEGWCGPACTTALAEKFGCATTQLEQYLIALPFEKDDAGGKGQIAGLAAVGLSSAWFQTTVDALIAISNIERFGVMVNWMASEVFGIKVPDHNHYSVFLDGNPYTVTLDDPMFGGGFLTLHRLVYEHHWHATPQDDDCYNVRPSDWNWALGVARTPADLQDLLELALIIEEK